MSNSSNCNFRTKCTWSTKLVEKCVDKPVRVCEKFWKNDGYGGKVWTEDLRKCHNLETNECMDEAQPIKVCMCRMWESNSSKLHNFQIGI